MTTATYPTISDDEVQQAFYERMRERGESHFIAEMCALQQVPGAKGCDRHFWENNMLDHGFGKDPMMPEILAEAKAAGISTTGKIYVGGLADGRHGADPMAWVSDISDVRYIAKQRGKNLDGITKFQADSRDESPPKPVRLAEDIVQDLMRREAQQNPAWLEDLEGLREYVIDRYGRPQ